MYEFLPLCDVLFNIISLVSYFCDLVFDVITIYTLYFEQDPKFFFITFSFICISLIISQICSFIWYIQKIRTGKIKECSISILLCIHIFQAGIIFRYFRLFIPVNLRHVKKDVRDLCILRLVHAFCEAAPMLLIQLYLIWLKPSYKHVTDLNIVSTLLSLFSLCWALASFNKYIREHNVHKIIMTWLGVFFQFLWRLGTVISRSLALSVYATLYSYWVLLVIILHWISMFLWLVSLKHIFHGDKMPFSKKLFYTVIIAFCYNFCFINFQESSSRRRVIAFYLTMLLENTLLVSIWLGSLNSTPWYQYGVTTTVFVSFFLGIVFMVLYYHHFHIRRLQHDHQLRQSHKISISCSACQMGECCIASHNQNNPKFRNGTTILAVSNNGKQSNKSNGSSALKDDRSAPWSYDTFSVPGVFNCRFNQVIKRKKKKPTSFVPPPAVGIFAGKVGKMQHPFWKLPLSDIPSNTTQTNNVSGVDIQQKLLEKKKQQVAELKKIEEEIQAGKITKPKQANPANSREIKQPIPRSKKSPWNNCSNEFYSYKMSNSSNLPTTRPFSKTPEILLSPYCLGSNQIFYEYDDDYQRHGADYDFPSDGASVLYSSPKSKSKNYISHPQKTKRNIYKSCRVPSDLDSQISIPRTYTLPRQFKYRRQRAKQMLKMDHFLTSMNSSDGDVDSAEENYCTFNGPINSEGQQINSNIGRFSGTGYNVDHNYSGLVPQKASYQSSITASRIPPKLPTKAPPRSLPNRQLKFNTHETQL